MFGTPWFAILVLVAAVLAVYANSLRGPFIFDDHYDIADNPTIRHLWPLGDVFIVRSASAVGLHPRPVVNLSFALDYAVGGLNTLPYHVTNLAIHLLAGLALFGVVRRTLLLPGAATVSEGHPPPWRWRWHCCGQYTLCKPRPSLISSNGTNR